MNNDLSRLKILCRILFVVLILITAIVLISLVTMLACIAIEIVEPGAISSVINVPGGSGTTASHGQTLGILTMLTILVGLSAAMTVMLMNIARSISREYSPFTAKNVNRLEVVSLLYLASPVAMAPLIYYVAGGIDAGTVIGLTLGSILIAAVFYCIALVFRYGAYLQKESDETL